MCLCYRFQRRQRNPHKSFPLGIPRSLLAACFQGAFALLFLVALAEPAIAAETQHHGGNEANLKLPDLNAAKFLGDQIGGRDLLFAGLVVSTLGLVFGLVICAAQEPARPFLDARRI